MNVRLIKLYGRKWDLPYSVRGMPCGGVVLHDALVLLVDDKTGTEFCGGKLAVICLPCHTINF